MADVDGGRRGKASCNRTSHHWCGNVRRRQSIACLHNSALCRRRMILDARVYLVLLVNVPAMANGHAVAVL